MSLLDPDDIAGMISDAGTDINVSGAGVIRGIVSDNYEALELGPHSAEGSRTIAVITQRDVEFHRIRKETVFTIDVPSPGVVYKVRRIETIRPGLARIFLALA